MELVLNGKNYKVPIKTIITGKLKKELMKVIEEKPINQFQLKIQEVLQETEAEDNVKTTIELLKSNKLQAIDIARFNSQSYIDPSEYELDEWYIKFFCKIVDENKVNAEIKPYLEDYKSEYWAEQDIMAIRAEVDLFRSKLGV